MLFYPDGKRSSSAEGAHIDAGGQLLPPHQVAGGAPGHAVGAAVDGAEMGGYAVAAVAAAAQQQGGGVVVAAGGPAPGGGGVHNQQIIARQPPPLRRDTTVSLALCMGRWHACAAVPVCAITMRHLNMIYGTVIKRYCTTIMC